MTSGVKQDDRAAACSMIKRLREYSKTKYDMSKRKFISQVVGEDDDGRRVTHPLKISHYFKVVDVDDSDVVEVVETVRNKDTGELEDKVVHYVGDTVVFRMDGLTRMRRPKKDGWLTDQVAAACLGIRYLENTVSPQKNQKLVCGEPRAQEMLTQHRGYGRKPKE